MAKFSAQVGKWSGKAKQQSLAVFRQAAQDTMQEANLPTGQGGKMRVDTGFLKGSVQASLDGLPSGPTKGEPGKRYHGQIAGKPAERVILEAQLGDKIWVGWTANYARFREYRDGFMRSAAQNWASTVRRAMAKVKAQFP